MRRARVIADGFSFLESPRWHDGRLYASDFYTHRVLAFDDRGVAEEICCVPGQPSGLGFAPDGALLVVSMLDRKVMRLEGRALCVFADLSSIATFHCNDMLVNPRGFAYVGNFGQEPSIDGTLARANLAFVDAMGHARVAAEDLVFPNGMVMPDSATLLVAETFASRITAFEVAADGALSGRRIWASLSERRYSSIGEAARSGQPLPDGMTLDAEGALWIGDAGGSAALRVAKDGEILDRIETPGLTTFAVTLGGSDGRTAFLCASPPMLNHSPHTTRQSVLMTCQVDVPGVGQP